MDKLMVDNRGGKSQKKFLPASVMSLFFSPINYFSFATMRVGKATISNDGATILKLLDVVHPAAKTLVDIARSQDAEVIAVSVLC